MHSKGYPTTNRDTVTPEGMEIYKVKQVGAFDGCLHRLTQTWRVGRKTNFASIALRESADAIGKP